jgi:hypothetical protein
MIEEMSKKIRQELLNERYFDISIKSISCLRGLLDKLTPLNSEEEARGKIYLGKVFDWSYDFFDKDSCNEPLYSGANNPRLLNKEIDALSNIAQTEGSITIYCLSESLGPFKAPPNQNSGRYEVYNRITSFYRDVILKGGEK